MCYNLILVSKLESAGVVEGCSRASVVVRYCDASGPWVTLSKAPQRPASPYPPLSCSATQIPCEVSPAPVLTAPSTLLAFLCHVRARHWHGQSKAWTLSRSFYSGMWWWTLDVCLVLSRTLSAWIHCTEVLSLADGVLPAPNPLWAFCCGVRAQGLSLKNCDFSF